MPPSAVSSTSPIGAAEPPQFEDGQRDAIVPVLRALEHRLELAGPPSLTIP